MDYRTVNKIMCSLEDGYTYFKGVLTWMHKNINRASLRQRQTLKKLLTIAYSKCIAKKYINIYSLPIVHFFFVLKDFLALAKQLNWLEYHVIHQKSCGFNPWLGHIRKVTNGCFSLSLSLSLKSINI